ncbi:hypothetical protein [Jiangella mangrovi]|uniref:Uncharacterized protein n=1 Tax=Jiangella mangrovi TaxID=1524084 RepID=A0A7W9GMF8_9ACTN|nr:hypothetical protein [Jiangella mangrovi]MBB5786231.1 hypothetical protein [Jiangella mangrovi]
MGDLLRRALDRPAVLVLLGTAGLLFALVAVGLGVWSLVLLARLGEASVCERDFSGICLTEREATVAERVVNHGRSWDPDPSWRLALHGDGPEPTDGTRLWVDFRPQDDLDELTTNQRVTVVFIEHEPAWLRLPSGAVLESNQHPQYTWAGAFSIAAMIAGPSITAVVTGIRGRRGGWFANSPGHGYGPDRWWLLFLVGLVGFVVQLAFPRPHLFHVLLGLGLLAGLVAYLVWRVLPVPSSGRHAPRRRRWHSRRRHSRGPDVTG